MAMELILVTKLAPNCRAYFVTGFQVVGVRTNLEPALREHDSERWSCLCDCDYAGKYWQIADHISQLAGVQSARSVQVEVETFVELV
jgi:hypothetical protein